MFTAGRNFHAAPDRVETCGDTIQFCCLDPYPPSFLYVGSLAALMMALITEHFHNFVILFFVASIVMILVPPFSWRPDMAAINAGHIIRLGQKTCPDEIVNTPPSLLLVICSRQDKMPTSCRSRFRLVSNPPPNTDSLSARGCESIVATTVFTKFGPRMPSST